MAERIPPRLVPDFQRWEEELPEISLLEIEERKNPSDTLATEELSKTDRLFEDVVAECRRLGMKPGEFVVHSLPTRSGWVYLAASAPRYPSPPHRPLDRHLLLTINEVESTEQGIVIQATDYCLDLDNSRFTVASGCANIKDSLPLPVNMPNVVWKDINGQYGLYRGRNYGVVVPAMPIDEKPMEVTEIIEARKSIERLEYWLHGCTNEVTREYPF